MKQVMLLHDLLHRGLTIVIFAFVIIDMIRLNIACSFMVS